MREVWKKVPGWPMYSVSNTGRVRRDVRSIRKTAGIVHDAKRARRNKQIILYATDGSRKAKLVHHLVLMAFVCPRPPNKEGRHLNDISSDNRLTNLQWGTRLQNCADRKRNKIPFGFEAMSKTKVKEISAMGSRAQWGLP